MPENVLPMFSSRSFTVSYLNMKGRGGDIKEKKLKFYQSLKGCVGPG